MAVSQPNNGTNKVARSTLHNVNMKLHQVESLIEKMMKERALLTKMQREEKRARAKAAKMNSKVAHLAKGSRGEAMSPEQVKKIAGPVRKILADIDKKRPKDQPYKDGICTALLVILQVGGQMKRGDIALVAQEVAPKGNTWGLKSCNWQLDRLFKAKLIKKPDVYGGKYFILAAGKREVAEKLGKVS